MKVCFVNPAFYSDGEEIINQAFHAGISHEKTRRGTYVSKVSNAKDDPTDIDEQSDEDSDNEDSNLNSRLHSNAKELPNISRRSKYVDIDAEFVKTKAPVGEDHIEYHPLPIDAAIASPSPPSPSSPNASSQQTSSNANKRKNGLVNRSPVDSLIGSTDLEHTTVPIEKLNEENTSMQSRAYYIGLASLTRPAVEYQRKQQLQRSGSAPPCPTLSPLNTRRVSTASTASNDMHDVNCQYSEYQFVKSNPIMAVKPNPALSGRRSGVRVNSEMQKIVFRKVFEEYRRVEWLHDCMDV